MGDLYLNGLPLAIEGSPDTVVARAWRRDDELDARLRELRGKAFQHYPYREKTYVWPTPSGELPPECRDRGPEITLGELPGAVVASAVRDAAIAHLVAKGFALRPGGLVHPARLTRRATNLAEGVVAPLPDGVGAYAALAVKGIPLLGDGRNPGEVALVIDQWVEHVLEVPLADLAKSGVELNGQRLRWHHGAGCACGDPARVGDAGRLVGRDPVGEVELRDDGGNHLRAPASCLAPHASTYMMARYLASLNGRGERDIAEALRKKTGAFSELKQRWTNLEKTGLWLGELSLFAGVTARVQPPLLLAQKQHLAGQRRPVVLPSVPEGRLNFRYGAPQLASNAARGLREHGPYDENQNRADVVRAVVLAPQIHEAEAKRLHRALVQGVERFKGVEERFHLTSFEAEIQLFPDATKAGYENAVLAATRAEPVFVFLVTEHDFRYAPRGQNPYFAAKAALASAGIPSQAITIESLRQSDSSLQWIADSVALAAYTKLGNIAYVLHDPEGGRELVLGIGRHDIYDPEQGGRHQRFGASVAVRQDGDFLFGGSTTPVSDDETYEQHLARLLEEAIDRYAKEQGGEPDRLVIYLFKRTGRRELFAIKRAIGERDIKFALLHANRHSPLWLFERSGNSVTSPPRGTTVAMSLRDRLLVTGDPQKPGGGHPLELVLDEKSTYTDMNRLVEQAYGFTKTSYRGFLQSNEPSPILFGRLLAEKVEQLVPYGFNPASAAGPLGNNPWFI
jgi:hypothetical protein